MKAVNPSRGADAMSASPSVAIAAAAAAFFVSHSFISCAIDDSFDFML